MNIDIPAETGFKYICVGSGAYNALQLYVYNVWLTKWDDWLSLASIANIKASSISDVLANSDIIFKNKEAVEFMIHNCTGDFMVSAIQNDTFITALENSEYADIVYENEHWAKFLAMVE